MPHVTDTQPGLPPGRYGSPRTLPRWALILLVVIGVAAITPVAVAVYHRSTPSVTSTVTGYTIVGANQVRATLAVHKPRTESVRCTMQAVDFYSEVVGTVDVDFTEAGTNVQAEKTFPTSNEAVVVQATGCVPIAGG